MASDITPIRCLHLADIHLNQSAASWPEQVACIEAIISRISDPALPPINMLALCGDFVDPKGKRHAKAGERNLIRSLVKAASHRASVKAIYVVPGNHDMDGDWSHLADMDYAWSFSGPDAVTFRASDDAPHHRLRIAALPYLCDTTALELRELALQLSGPPPQGSHIPPSIPAILLHHGPISGSRLSATQILPTSEPALDPAALDGFSLVLTGHIHKAQTLYSPAGTPIIYPGSPWPHDHGEEDDSSHGYVIHSIDPATGRLISSERFPLPYAPRRSIRLRYDGEQGLVLKSTGEPPTADDLAPLQGAKVRAIIEHPRGVELAEWPQLRRQLLAAGVAETCKHSILDSAPPAAVPALALAEPGADNEPRDIAAQLAAAIEAGAIVIPDHVTQEWLDAALRAAPTLRTTDGADTSQAVGVRKIIKVELANIGRWAGTTATINLSDPRTDDDASPLVWLQGPSGAGKSSLLSLAGPGLAFGICPNYGPITSLACEGTGYAETTLIDGAGRTIVARLTFRAKRRPDGNLDVDPSGSIHVNGEPVTGIDGKVTRFRGWLQANVYGSIEAYLMLVHSRQRTAEAGTALPSSFSEGGPEARATLFRFILGLDAIDGAQTYAAAHESELAAKAKDYAAACGRAESLAAELAEATENAEALAITKDGKAIERDKAADVATAATAKVASASQATAEAHKAMLDAYKARERAAQATAAAEALAQASTALRGAEANHDSAAHALAQATEAHRQAELASAEPAIQAQRKEQARQELHRATWACNGAQVEASRATQAKSDAESIAAIRRREADDAAKVLASVPAPNDEPASVPEPARAEVAQAKAAEQAAAEALAQATSALDATTRAGYEAEALSQATTAAHRAAEKTQAEAEAAAESLAKVGCASLPTGPLPCHLIDRARALAGTLDAARESVAASLAAFQAAAANLATANESRAKAQSLANQAKADAQAATQKRAAVEASIEATLRAAESARRAAANNYANAERASTAAAHALAQATQALEHATQSEAAASTALATAQENATRARIAFDALPAPDQSASEAVTRAATALTQARATYAQAAQALNTARERHDRAAHVAESFAGALTEAQATAATDAAQCAHTKANEAEVATRIEQAAANLALAQARAEFSAAQNAYSMAQGRAETLTTQLATAQALADSLAEASREAKRWGWLSQTMRRLASLTVDASKAAIEARINDYLARVWASRFSARLAPEVATKDGEGTVRRYDILIHDADTEGVSERPLKRYSGGEQAVLRLAVQCALLELAADRTPARWGMVVVDEADAALDDDAQKEWQSMVARVVEVSGLAQALIVTHRGFEAGARPIVLTANSAE